MSGMSIAELDAAIEKALKFQSMTVEGEAVTNQNILSLMKARQLLQQEEDRKSGKRCTFATFDVSEQSF
jgi:hypothetical protein